MRTGSGYVVLGLILLLGFAPAWAQKKQTHRKGKVLQFSGQVVDNETREPLSGVHIFIPETGRGTTSNYYGFFTMPIVAGDSVVVSVVGYHRKSYKVPEDYKKDITFVLSLKYDTLYLPDLEIKPYPTEEEFKKAVLAMELPRSMDFSMTMGNASGHLVRQGAYSLGYDDAAASFSQQTKQQFEQIRNTNMMPTSNYLNPFAWIRFLRDAKRKKNSKK